jgi:flagellum-specific peptidoglycan hydrolase FlgJ
VKQVETSKNIARNKFYNVQGIETAQPQKGVNIQVTEYTDGSKKTVKILK